MEDRVRLYKEGVSISAIARKEGVSRQAIQNYLKRSGIFAKEVKLDLKEPKNNPTVEFSKKPAPGDVLDYVPNIDLEREDGKWRRAAKNLYVSNKGYMVKYFSNGGFIENVYPDRDSVLKAHDLL